MTKRVARKEVAEEQQRPIRNRNRGQGTEAADWSNAKPELVSEAIAAVTVRNCAIQFGYTRDGGAFCVRVVGDGEPYNEYIRPTEDIDLYLNGLIEDFKGA